MKSKAEKQENVVMVDLSQRRLKAPDYLNADEKSVWHHVTVHPNILHTGSTLARCVLHGRCAVSFLLAEHRQRKRPGPISELG